MARFSVTAAVFQTAAFLKKTEIDGGLSEPGKTERNGTAGLRSQKKTESDVQGAA